MTRFLTCISQEVLLEELRQNGFEFETLRPFEQTTNDTDSAIWLGEIEGTAGFHANVTECAGVVFSTEIPAPTTPYNVFQ